MRRFFVFVALTAALATSTLARSAKVFYVFANGDTLCVVLGKGETYTPNQDTHLWVTQKGLPATAKALAGITYISESGTTRYTLDPTVCGFATDGTDVPGATRLIGAQYVHDPTTNVTRIIPELDKFGADQPLDPLGVTVLRLQRKDDSVTYLDSAKAFFGGRGYDVVKQALVDEAFKSLRIEDPTGNSLTTSEVVELGKMTGAKYVVVGKVETSGGSFSHKSGATVEIAIYDTVTGKKIGDTFTGSSQGNGPTGNIDAAVKVALSGWGQ